MVIQTPAPIDISLLAFVVIASGVPLFFVWRYRKSILPPPEWIPALGASTDIEEDDALACILADPARRDWPARTMIVAGRAALAREIRRARMSGGA